MKNEMMVMMMMMMMTLQVMQANQLKVYLYISSDLLDPSTVEVGKHNGNFLQCFYRCDYKSHY